MKKIIILGSMIAFIVLMAKCTDDIDSGKTLKHSKTILGGCNDEDITKSHYIDEKDTVIFTIRNIDTLNVFVGMNYICCAPFASEARVNNDTILITIDDTCSSDSAVCYCHCVCYYTWDFQYTEFEHKEYNFKIYLKTPDTDSAIIFKEGAVDLSSR